MIPRARPACNSGPALAFGGPPGHAREDPRAAAEERDDDESERLRRARAARSRRPRMTAAALVLALVAAALVLAAAAPAAQAGHKTTGLVRGVVVLGPLHHRGPRRAARVAAAEGRGEDLPARPVRALAHAAHRRGRALLGAPHGRALPLHGGAASASAPCRSRTTSPHGQGRPHTEHPPVAGHGPEFPEAERRPGTASRRPPASRRRTSTRQGVLGTHAPGPDRTDGQAAGAQRRALRRHAHVLPAGRQQVARGGQHQGRTASSSSLPAGDLRRRRASAVSTFDRGGPFTLKVPRGAVAVADRPVRHGDPVHGPRRSGALT